MSAYVEALSVFYQLGDPGVVAATYTAVGGSARPVYGELLRPSADQFAGLVNDSKPSFQCAVVDVPGVTHGAALVIAAESFKVCGIDPDGSGVVHLKLQQQ